MTAPPTPFWPFTDWLNHALDRLPMANAMGLATATRTGVPSLRTVLLKDVFFTSLDTLKVRHMTENPHVPPDLVPDFRLPPESPKGDITC